MNCNVDTDFGGAKTVRGYCTYYSGENSLQCCTGVNMLAIGGYDSSDSCDNNLCDFNYLQNNMTSDTDTSSSDFTKLQNYINNNQSTCSQTQILSCPPNTSTVSESYVPSGKASSCNRNGSNYSGYSTLDKAWCNQKL